MYKLLFTNYNNKILSAIYEGGRMVEVSLEDKEASSIIGNIYVGRVEKVVASINAAFIEFSKGEKGYYSLEDNKEHIFLNRKNTDKVCQGDLMLVQVERDAVKTKAPILTGKLNLSGKYVVLNKNATGINISNKIKDKATTKAIKAALKSFESEDYGIVARTNCETLMGEDGFDETELVAEITGIVTEFKRIIELSPTRTAFTLMKGNRADYLDHVINARVEDLEEIVTDDPNIYNEIKGLGDLSIIERLKFYQDDLLPLYKLYSVETQLLEALKERVWLKSGGYLVIQPTEALTVIDVNTGKFVAGKGNREAGFLKVNKEAAVEIAKQIRLRNYSGIIIVDFIDMKEPGYNQELLAVLNEAIAGDPVKTTVVDITKLGLVEMTRKKVKKPLYEQV